MSFFDKDVWKKPLCEKHNFRGSPCLQCIMEEKSALQSQLFQQESRIKELEAEISEQKETIRKLNAPLLHFATLDKMPTLGLLDREGVIKHVVDIGKTKCLPEFQELLK